MINLKEIKDITESEIENLIMLDNDIHIDNRDVMEDRFMKLIFSEVSKLKIWKDLKEYVLNDNEISEKGKIIRLKVFELLFSNKDITEKEMIVIVNIYKTINKEDYMYFDTFISYSDYEYINNILQLEQNLIFKEDFENILLKLIDLCIIEFDEFDEFDESENSDKKFIHLIIFDDLIL